MPPNSKGLILAACALGMFSANLPSIPIAVIVPTIADAFGVDIPSAQWLMTAHFVALAATMLPIGAAGDILGRWRVYVAGLGVMLLSLAATPFVPSLDALIVLRAVQGVGAGMVMVTTPAIISETFDDRERGRSIGALFLGGWLASGLGPPVFGLLLQWLPWHAAFTTMLIPTAAGLGLALCLRRVDVRTARPFDRLGAALLVMTFGLLVIGVGHGQEERWELVHTAEHVGPLMLISIGAGVLYVFHARRQSNALLPLELFRSLTLTTASITNGLVHMTMLMISFLMPFYLQNVLGYTPFSVALMLLPMGIALNVMAFPGGWLYDKFGSRGPCAIAMVMGVALLLSYLGLNEHSTLMDILPRLVMSGVVLGLFVTPNVSAMLASVPSQHYSLTAGLEQTTRNLGHALGVVVASGVAAFVLGPSETAWTAETYIAVVHGASAIAGATMAAGLLLALMRDEGRTPAPLKTPEPAATVP